MNLKLKDVGVFGLATQSLFDSPSVNAVVKAYNTNLGGSWEVDVFVVQLDAVLALVGTRVLIKLRAGDTKKINGYMEDERSILTDLEFKIGLCIVAGTISDSLGSFNLGAFRDAINRHNLGAFHLAYEATLSRINDGGNAAALDGVGFSGVDIVSITAAHDLAWDLGTVRVDLNTSIGELSVANRVVVATFMATCQVVIDSIRAYASKMKDVDLIGRASAVAVKRSVVYTVAKKPFKRHIAENTSVCFKEHPVIRDLMQFTLLTEGGEAFVCRMGSKTGSCVMGIQLVFNEMLEIKKRDVPGSGDCIIISNTGSGKVVVRVFTIKG